jgi:hypothetical protein
MNALDCVRNAVFAVLIELVRAFTDADTPATAIATTDGVDGGPGGGASAPDPTH